MKKLMLAFVLCYPLMVFSQSFSKNDFVGTWNIVKANICINDTSKFTVYLKENAGKTDTIVEIGGPELKERSKLIADAFMKSILKFSADDSFSWVGPEDGMALSNKFWSFDDQTKKIKIRDTQDKESKVEVEFAIVNFEKGKIYLMAVDGSVKIKIDLVKNI